MAIPKSAHGSVFFILQRMWKRAISMKWARKLLLKLRYSRCCTHPNLFSSFFLFNLPCCLLPPCCIQSGALTCFQERTDEVLQCVWGVEDKSMTSTYYEWPQILPGMPHVSNAPTVISTSTKPVHVLFVMARHTVNVTTSGQLYFYSLYI